ncbi:ABC transporter permease [Pseudomonas typographi]|uniref:ABC transporter permease n=1 Tax=Pseudomonas typographi TaxID=2715964 RepID=UPI001682AA57|nr:ABC transporter permease [Pseudomonas typographi]MBD1551933.1 ABC transporter permease [Pseudomonas typographi]
MSVISLRKLRRGTTIPALILLAWWAVYAFGITDSKLFVPPGQVLTAAATLSEAGELWPAVGQSLLRAMGGFILGAGIGLIMGVLLGMSSRTKRFFSLTLHSVKQVSLFAWLPLISVWFGYEDGSKVVFIALAAFFPVVLNTLEGVGNVPRDWVDVARVSHFTPWQMFARLVLPAALPSIFNGIYLSLVFSWLATLGAEYLLGSGIGLGTLLFESRAEFKMDVVLVGLVLTGFIGFALDIIAKATERRLLRWRENTVGA